MLNNLYRLSSVNHEERKSVLYIILEENNIPFISQKETAAGKDIENIIVRLGSSPKRLVVGAHYDSIEGSSGANDNASGVCILIELARFFSNLSPSPELDIVFFDWEEVGGLGSTLYLNQTSKENLHAMINLDICGVGEKILSAPVKNTVSGPLSDAFKAPDISKHDYEVIGRLPTGDERIFEENEVPNISVCILPKEDVVPMKELFAKGDNVTPEDFPSIIETMHNGPRDNAGVVELSAMQKVYEFAKDLILNFNYSL